MIDYSDKIPQVQKTNVSKETFDILLHNIMDGTWKKGEKIPSENELKNSLMVSRHTIRSAISNLNMLGILETRRGDGNYVKETGIGLYIDFLIPYLMLNQSDSAQIIEFRESIEVSAARYAALRATDEDLKIIYEKLQLCIANQHNTVDYPTYDMAFHGAIANASKNELLIQSFNVIQKYCFNVVREYFDDTMASKGSDYHQQIYAALVNHDPDSATHYMSEHMHNILNRINNQ